MASSSQTLPTLDELLDASSAAQEFSDALRQLARGGKPGPAIRFNAGSPPVKVRRALCQLLETHPDLVVQSVSLEGRSGCSDFRGTMAVETPDGEATYRFVWDCAWKAGEVGYKTFWGDPDQQKAAREFDYRCFEVFEKVT